MLIGDSRCREMASNAAAHIGSNTAQRHVDRGGNIADIVGLTARSGCPHRKPHESLSAGS